MVCNRRCVSLVWVDAVCPWWYVRCAPHRGCPVVQACAGLAHVHEQGFVHMDVKMENMLLVNNTVKLCDFGLAGPHGQVGVLCLKRNLALPPARHSKMISHCTLQDV